MSKPDLILLHGALGSAAQFDPWLPLLTPDYEVHTLDFEGHGAQPFADRPFAIPHFAENLQTLIAERGLVAPRVFGYSMGGYVALYLARHQPGLLGRIITLATKFDWHPAGAAAEVKRLDPSTMRAKVPQFAAQLAARHHGNDWEQHLAKTAALMLGLGDAPALTVADFAALQVPVRLGLGDRDKMVTLEETVAAYRQLPQGELYVLPGTGHLLEGVVGLQFLQWP
jgi:pimeloyl-ACP methyl ester carboxylesterase